MAFRLPARSASLAVPILILTAGTVAAESGIAAAYPYSYQGRRTASGERFNPHAMTCAHKRHPFGAMLRVNAGGRSIVCRVTDRGPFEIGRSTSRTRARWRAP